MHFFPASDAATAPYPATCKLTLFGRDFPSKSVTLEGGRLGYPDGVRIEDAFPMLNSLGGGSYGLEIEISTTQPRLDLVGSSCSVDFHSQGMSAHFRPVVVDEGEMVRLMNIRGESTSFHWDSRMPANADEPKKSGGENLGRPPQLHTSARVGLAMQDRFHSTSLVVVNHTMRGIRSRIQAVSYNQSRDPVFITADIESQSVGEVVIPESFYVGSFEQECGWGSFKCSPVEISFQPENQDEGTGASGGLGLFREVASFVVHRDIKSRRVASVVGL